MESGNDIKNILDLNYLIDSEFENDVSINPNSFNFHKSKRTVESSDERYKKRRQVTDKDVVIETKDKILNEDEDCLFTIYENNLLQLISNQLTTDNDLDFNYSKRVCSVIISLLNEKRRKGLLDKIYKLFDKLFDSYIKHCKGKDNILEKFTECFKDSILQCEKMKIILTIVFDPATIKQNFQKHFIHKLKVSGTDDIFSTEIPKYIKLITESSEIEGNLIFKSFSKFYYLNLRSLGTDFRDAYDDTSPIKYFNCKMDIALLGLTDLNSFEKYIDFTYETYLKVKRIINSNSDCRFNKVLDLIAQNSINNKSFNLKKCVQYFIEISEYKRLQKLQVLSSHVHMDDIDLNYIIVQCIANKALEWVNQKENIRNINIIDKIYDLIVSCDVMRHEFGPEISTISEVIMKDSKYYFMVENYGNRSIYYPCEGSLMVVFTNMCENEIDKFVTLIVNYLDYHMMKDSLKQFDKSYTKLEIFLNHSSNFQEHVIKKFAPRLPKYFIMPDVYEKLPILNTVFQYLINSKKDLISVTILEYFREYKASLNSVKHYSINNIQTTFSRLSRKHFLPLNDDTLKLPNVLQNIVDQYLIEMKSSGLNIDFNYLFQRLEIEIFFDEHTLKPIIVDCTIYQAVILLAFEEKEKLSFPELLKKTGISRAYLMKNLQCMMKNDHNIILHNGKFSINNRFKIDTGYIKLPYIKVPETII